MKTITEFDGFFLKRVIEKFTALSADSKTPEEIQIAIGEEFKAEGDKLKYLMAAIDFAKPKILGLKRVLVSSIAEGEKAPSGYMEKEGQYFSLEHFPQPPKPVQKGRGDGRNDRGGKRGGKDGKRGKPRRDSRGPKRGDGQERTVHSADSNTPQREARPQNRKPRPQKPPVERPPAKVKITFNDGKPNIQTASNNPSPETQSQSPSQNQAEQTADSSQSS